MTDASDPMDLIVHVGPAHTGGPTLARALSGLRVQLRRRNVALLGADDMVRLPSLAGSAMLARPDRNVADRFAAELRTLAQRERSEAEAAASGEQPPRTLVTAQRLLGYQRIGTADIPQFRPSGVAGLSQLINALGACRTRVVLFSRRQDRLMEHAYLAEVMEGRYHSFADQFPRPTDPVLDFADLADRLHAVPGVIDVVVHPFERVQHNPRRAVAALLSALDLGDEIDPSRAGTIDFGTSYSTQGMNIALAMNPHVDSVDEQALVRDFILSRFVTPNVPGTRFLSKPERAAILAAYREPNRRLFRRYLPGLPEDAYDDDAGTRQLRPRTKQQRKQAQMAGSATSPPRSPSAVTQTEPKADSQSLAGTAISRLRKLTQPGRGND